MKEIIHKILELRETEYKALSEYASDELDENLIKRIQARANCSEVSLWISVYRKIMKEDPSAEFSAGFIYALKLIEDEIKKLPKEEK